MRWDPGHESEHVRDDRGRMSSGGVSPGLAWLAFRIASRFGVPGIVVLVLGFVALQFVGSSGMLGGSEVSGPQAEEMRHFVGFVLDDVQASWQRQFAARNRPYRAADLVLFTGQTSTGCGYGDAATGPFYCPDDERVYIDLSFYQDLTTELGAPGDFAEAYVIAHEIGHHVQKQLGLADVTAPSKGAKGGSVRLELQADCFAGIWARDAQQRQVLDPGDVEEALRAAASIGDDRLQSLGNGQVQPETWTHGSSAQRMRWFHEGFAHGTIEACDTLHAATL